MFRAILAFLGFAPRASVAPVARQRFELATLNASDKSAARYCGGARYFGERSK